MNRKKYEKPAMAVVKCEQSGYLLVGSGDDPTRGHGGEYGYMPGQTGDLNHLA